jgi:hypothetical protein
VAVAKGLFEVVDPETKLWDDMPSEIRYRLRNPDLFQADSFRRIPVKRDSPKVFGIVGKLKNEDAMTLQALRFPKDEGWDMSKAQTWVKAHPDVKTNKIEEILLKMLQDAEEIQKTQIAEKEGRVLSTKNRELIKSCLEALTALYSATEPKPETEPPAKDTNQYDQRLNDLMDEVNNILKKI